MRSERAEEPRATSRTPRRRAALEGALLVVLTVTAYLPAIRGGYVWDDDFHVTSNRNLADLGGLLRIWLTTSATPQYYPMTHTTFWIENHLWDLHPLGYHLVNVLLHATCAILLWRLLRALSVPGAWLCALIFALHPVHVESVAWITERKNVLSGAFCLGSAVVFLRAAAGSRAGRGSVSAARRSVLPAVSLALFVCALLSKTVTASLPVVLALLIWWRWGRIARRELGWLAAMAVSGAALGLLTVFLEKTHVGARGPAYDFSWVERSLIAGRALWFYLGKLAWPSGLSFVYPRWSIDPRSALPYAFPLAAAVSLVTLWLLRELRGRGPFVALASFVVILGPALGFLDVYPMRYSFVADHFQYLASIGPIGLFAAGWATLPDRLGRQGRALKKGVRASAAVLVAVLGALTWNQAHAYRDAETLWRSALRSSPSAYMAHYNLGKLLSESGRVDEAIEHYEAALASKPDLVEALSNLGVALAAKGRVDEAIARYEEALRIDPDHAITLYDLGLALEQKGRRDEAERAYRAAIRALPGLAGAHNNLAVLLYLRGDYGGAWAEVGLARRAGLEPHPDFLKALSEKMPAPRS